MYFLALFIVLAALAERINFSALVGTENQFFTLFQFFGPIAGGFLGSVLGPLAVLLAELLNFVLFGKTFTLLNLYRLLPMVIAAFYFGSLKEKKQWAQANILIPALCILAFVSHPVGREVWYFSLYWLIPILARLKPLRNHLLARSYGATFTAHAVGGAAWVWTVPMTAGQWINLIPVVAYERLLFGAGIAVSYVIFNTVLDKVSEKTKQGVVQIEKKYVLGRNFLKASVDR